MPFAIFENRLQGLEHSVLQTSYDLQGLRCGSPDVYAYGFVLKIAKNCFCSMALKTHVFFFFFLAIQFHWYAII